METKIVQRFGNSGHIVMPKEYVGKRIRFIAEPKIFGDIKSEVLEILKPYLENIVGVYLYGSYARNEQTINSDIDILVITSNKLKIIDKIDDYTIASINIKELENTLKNNAILILPIIYESKTIINPNLINKYKGYKFTKKNTKKFIIDSYRILKFNKKGLKLDFEIGSLVYSLMLRIRGLLMIKLMSNNKLYSKSLLFSYLGNYFEKNKIEELYRIYGSERNDIKIKTSDIIKNSDIKKLIVVAERLLREAKALFK